MDIFRMQRYRVKIFVFLPLSALLFSGCKGIALARWSRGIAINKQAVCLPPSVVVSCQDLASPRDVRLQPQDEMSRHRGAKQRRRWGRLGAISLLSLEYLLSVER